MFPLQPGSRRPHCEVGSSCESGCGAAGLSSSDTELPLPRPLTPVGLGPGPPSFLQRLCLPGLGSLRPLLRDLRSPGRGVTHVFSFFSCRTSTSPISAAAGTMGWPSAPCCTPTSPRTSPTRSSAARTRCGHADAEEGPFWGPGGGLPVHPWLMTQAQGSVRRVVWAAPPVPGQAPPYPARTGPVQFSSVTQSCPTL